jgi:hypothetical protein
MKRPYERVICEPTKVFRSLQLSEEKTSFLELALGNLRMGCDFGQYWDCHENSTAKLSPTRN